MHGPVSQIFGSFLWTGVPGGCLKIAGIAGNSEDLVLRATSELMRRALWMQADILWDENN